MLFPWEALENQYKNRPGIPQPHTIWWNSKLRTVKSVVAKEHDLLTEVCTAENRPEVVFSSREWDLLNEMENLLEPIVEATDKLQAKKVSKTVRTKSTHLSKP